MLTFSLENSIMLIAAILTIFLLIFVINWHYFSEWIAVYLFKCIIDFAWGSPVVNLHMLVYPVRLLPHYYNTCIFFELLVFPVMCIWYNQVTRKMGLYRIVGYALLFSAGITIIEYPLERYTDLIKYINWSWFTTFYTLTITFLLSRSFMAFYRWGCNYFPKRFNP